MRHLVDVIIDTIVKISIHASRMGCDGVLARSRCGTGHFNPRIPYGMRHRLGGITALAAHFNPRIPYGMRRRREWRRPASTSFQSTHPVWDATILGLNAFKTPYISIHASRMGCDAGAAREPASSWRFQSTHPVWDATACSTASSVDPTISIHASRMGCDLSGNAFGEITGVFQSTHPVWDATLTFPRLLSCFPDFNPRIPYGMRRAAMRDYSAPQQISIHASRMGCDGRDAQVGTLRLDFNPRIPYGMRPHENRQPASQSHISIHASRMGCDHRTFGLAQHVPISIHASRMGCDPGCEIRGSDLVISIHASRMGCDTLFLLSSWKVLDFNPRIPYGMRLRVLGADHLHFNFNPRIPYGMRRVHVDEDCVLRRFQSTHPVWDATRPRERDTRHTGISIHASRMGCDLMMQLGGIVPALFQSTHPVWDATYACADWPTQVKISIHASRMGCDHGHQPRNQSQKISIHASRMGCDAMPARWCRICRYFNPRIPYGMRRSVRRRFRLKGDFNPRIPYGMRLA